MGIKEENQKLKNQNQVLRAENDSLKNLLGVAKIWIQKEVRNSVVKRAKKKIGGVAIHHRDSFFHENSADMITQRMSDFFGELTIMGIPHECRENIISGEIHYYNLKMNPIGDGLSVVSSYHKSIDVLIETYITKGFRSFALKHGAKNQPRNNMLEKSLYQVISKGYILSIGRLYHILDCIKNDAVESFYVGVFRDYIEQNIFLKGILLNDDFFQVFSRLIDTEVLGKKRHEGKISFEETTYVRNLFIGDFKEKNCLIYALGSLGDVAF